MSGDYVLDVMARNTNTDGTDDEITMTVIIDKEDAIEMMRRNARDEDEQQSHVLRITPPFEGEKKASLHVAEDGTRYPDEMNPTPIHLGAHDLFSGADLPSVTPARDYPTRGVEKTKCCAHYGVDYPSELDDEQWNEWWDAAIEEWERPYRKEMDDPVEITVVKRHAPSELINMKIRFE